MFADDADASRASILAIADAADGKVRVAHFGTLETRSLANLVARNRSTG
jgi:hypothetical protein